MSLMSMFPGGGGTNNQPLKAPTNLKAEMNTTTSVQITWTDPENEYSQPSGALIGEWMFTRIVRKVGSAPVNANDGELIVESAVKNQYQTTPYIDSSNIVTGTTYYYAAFAFTKSRVSSPGAIFELVANWYDPVLSNNTWTMINQAFKEGVASSLWSKGDTKTDANGRTFSLELLYPNTSQFSLSDGSQPYAIFTLNRGIGSDATLSRYGGPYVDEYAKSYLYSRIHSQYAGLSEELQSFIHPMNFTLCYGDGDPSGPFSGGWDSLDTKINSDYVWPMGVKYWNIIFPTTADLANKVGSTSKLIYFGDCSLESDGTDHGASFSHNNRDGWAINSYGQASAYHENAVMFYGFAFGKVGA